MQIPSFVCSGTMVIELHEFNDKKKKNTMDKMLIIWPKSGNLFGTQITFDMFCAVKSVVCQCHVQEMWTAIRKICWKLTECLSAAPLAVAQPWSYS